MLQNIGFVFALGQIQVYKRIKGIGFQSVFRLQYQRPLGGGRLLLPLQLRVSLEARSLLCRISSMRGQICARRK